MVLAWVFSLALHMLIQKIWKVISGTRAAKSTNPALFSFLNWKNGIVISERAFNTSSPDISLITSSFVAFFLKLAAHASLSKCASTTPYQHSTFVNKWRFIDSINQRQEWIQYNHTLIASNVNYGPETSVGTSYPIPIKLPAEIVQAKYPLWTTSRFSRADTYCHPRKLVETPISSSCSIFPSIFVYSP